MEFKCGRLAQNAGDLVSLYMWWQREYICTMSSTVLSKKPHLIKLLFLFEVFILLYFFCQGTPIKDIKIPKDVPVTLLADKHASYIHGYESSKSEFVIFL